MTVEIVSLWSLGALFGLRHAFEPDHLAAVTTLVTGRSSPRAALGIGAAWGLGHTLALLAVASVLAVARRSLSPTLAVVFELGVGLMLILLGVLSMRRAAADRQVDDAASPSAPASPPRAGGRQRRFSGAGWTSARRSLLVGLVHGAAGSGAITALIAAQFPSVAGRIAYVAVFGLGSMIGMAGLSGLAGVPLGRANLRPTLRRALGLTGGAVAIAIGIVWVVRETRVLLG
jgi:hypothetical protein